MSLFASLDAKDRKLLLGCLIAVVVIAIATALFSRDQNEDDNPVPSSHSTGKHGAQAAFELLQRSGYTVERWERPLNELSGRADAQTVVIFAGPTVTGTEDLLAVREILARGGRVLVTGWMGGRLAPGNSVLPPAQFQAACKLTAQGLDPLAFSGEVWMSPASTWGTDRPRDRIQYNCAGAPAVVEYPSGMGTVIWWASSTPLENGSIARAQNLNLFLNSLGPRQGTHIYWDESLHGELHTEWFYAKGPALTMLIFGTLAIALLTIFSFSRHSGPVRDLPAPVRATPVEFLEALGSLYAEAGAAATAVEIACERFRRRTGELCGLKTAQMGADQLSFALRRRFPQVDKNLEADLAACETAARDDTLKPQRALELVRLLNRHGDELEAAVRAKTLPRGH
jgi:hypothetical protein